MLFVLFSLFYGFFTITVQKDLPVTYDIVGNQFFFSVLDSDSTDLIIGITSEKNETVLSDLHVGSYYEVEGDSITFYSSHSQYNIACLMLQNASCPDITYSLDLDSYSSLDFSLFNESIQMCLLFYSPKRDYRVFSTCYSNNRDSECFLVSSNKIATGLLPETCLANTTCDDSLSDGFLLKSVPFAGSSIRSKTSVSVIKGKKHGSRCSLLSVSKLNSQGIMPQLNYSVKSYLKCIPPEETVQIAVILVLTLLFLIFFGVILYYQCRPNREAYESNSDIPKIKPSSRLLKHEKPNGQGNKWV